MTIEVITHYDKDDVKMHGEWTKDVIINGTYLYQQQDEYHHRISSKIEGILDYLNHTNTLHLVINTSVCDGNWN